MPPNPAPYRIVRRKLRAAGFIEVSQEGSHIKFSRKDSSGIRTVIVPHHSEVTSGTLRSILHQAGISYTEWDNL